MGCGKSHGRNRSGQGGLEPTRRTDAPSVARLETGESPVGPGGREVVAGRLRELEEPRGDRCAHRVGPNVLVGGVAAAVAEEPGDGIGAALLEFATEDIAGRKGTCHAPYNHGSRFGRVTVAPGDRGRMPRWNRALVTGASSGIGAAIARQLAADGTELVVVARDRSRLDALAAAVDVETEVLVADLSDPADVALVAARIRSTDDPVDLLVNNAGLGFTGRYADLDQAQERGVVAVNVVALHELSHAAAVAMSATRRGGILNIASVAGYLPSAGGATYAATKAFVNSFSESLHQDLGDAGVTVTVSCPGYTRTEFHDRADIDPSEIPRFLWQDAETVAADSLAAVAAGKARVVPGTLNKIAVGFLKVAPLRLVRRLTRTEFD